MGKTKSKIGERGYHLIEERVPGDTRPYVALMYGDLYVLRFKDGMIELATSIFEVKELKVDVRGRVLISEYNF